MGWVVCVWESGVGVSSPHLTLSVYPTIFYARFPGPHSVSRAGIITLITYICETFYISNPAPMLIVSFTGQDKTMN